MTAVLLIIPYLIISAYLILHVFRLTGAVSVKLKTKIFRTIFLIFFTVIATSPLTSFLINSGPVHRFLKKLNNIWLGFMLYIILILLIMDLVIIVLRITKKLSKKTLRSRRFIILSRSAAFLLAFAVSLYGVINAGYIRKTEYDVTVSKKCGSIDSLNVALIADLHLGYSIGIKHMEQMVKKINAMQPDLVLIAGDIYDNEYDAVENPEKMQQLFASIQSKYGVYACWGNHDIDETLFAGFTFGNTEKKEPDKRMETMLTDAGVRLLSDEAVLIDNAFYIAGRNDPSRAKKASSQRASADELLSNLDKSKPIFVIDHQPKEFDELKAAGADVDFSGHTHDGQMFPGNLLTSLMWDNSCGKLTEDNFTSIVTSGVGVWGPNMRVGTKSEIAQVHITFKGNQ